MSEDKKIKRPRIPTEAQVIREFIAEAEAFRAKAECDGVYPHEALVVARANADAREALASRLEYVRNQRAQAVQEAAQQMAAAIAKTGESLAQRLKGAGPGNQTEK